MKSTMMNKFSTISLLSASLALAVGCSGGSGNGGGGGNADADIGPDADLAACAVAEDFADLGDAAGNAFAANQYLTVDVVLEQSSTDLFVVELFSNAAPFENGFKTGTFEISGAQTDYNTCGACVSVWANVAGGKAEMVYLAQSGTLVIESVEGNFTGSFTPNASTASFVGYKPTSDTSSELRAQCTLNGGSVAWDEAIATE